MSIPVDPSQLETELVQFGYSAFLLTVRDDQTSHVAHMTFRFENDNIYCPIKQDSSAQRRKTIEGCCLVATI